MALPGTEQYAFPWANGEQNGLNKREMAALMLCLPDSGTDWMDDMIRIALRVKFVEAATQAIITARNTRGEGSLYPELAMQEAIQCVDAAIQKEIGTR